MRSIYLITGATSEIGMAYIEKLIEGNETATVIAVYRTMSDRFGELIAKESNLDIFALHADLSVEEDVEALIENINEEELIPTHILHLAAANYVFNKIKQWDAEAVKRDMQISVFSFARICQEYLPKMAKQHYGKVVAMLSSVTLGAPPKFVSQYATVKGALLGFVKSAAAEYVDKSINVNAISPNMMETKFLADIDSRLVEMAAANSSMKRNVKVNETVDAIEFLMSDRASYINGENLNLSGGDYM